MPHQNEVSPQPPFLGVCCVFTQHVCVPLAHLASALGPAFLAGLCQGGFCLLITARKGVKPPKRPSHRPLHFCSVLSKQVFFSFCHLPQNLHCLLIGNLEIVYCALLFLCPRAKTKASRPCEAHICMRQA